METHRRLAICGALWQVWRFIRDLVDDTWRKVYPYEQLTFLGITREGEMLPAALLGLHRIVWKMVIISLTQAEYEKKPVSSISIVDMSVRRLTVRIRALHASYITKSRAAITRETPSPTPASVHRWITPIAEVDKRGDLVWHPAWRRRAEDHGVRI